jgi:hypothetical protein
MYSRIVRARTLAGPCMGILVCMMAAVVCVSEAAAACEVQVQVQRAVLQLYMIVCSVQACSHTAIFQS